MVTAIGSVISASRVSRAGWWAFGPISTALRASFYVWMIAIVLAVLLGLVGGPLAVVPIVLALVWTAWRWLTMPATFASGFARRCRRPWRPTHPGPPNTPAKYPSRDNRGSSCSALSAAARPAA